MKILVTGFHPFGGEVINPSIECVKRLPDYITDAQIIKLEIPTVKHKSLSVIQEAINLHHPDMILSIGQAGGRSDISIERIGVNVDDYRIPDNEGNQPIDEPIFKDGPDAYFTTLPIKAMVEHIRKHAIPASISNTAGTFVCNHVCYGVCYLLKKEKINATSGFIHIPYLPSQVLDKPNTASMALSDIVAGLTHAIEAMVLNTSDIKKSEGAIC